MDSQGERWVPFMRKNAVLLSKIALFIAALIWGSSAFVLKNTLDEVPPNTTNAIRFLLSAFALAAVYYKKLKLLNREYWLHGGIMGIFLVVGYYGRTAGMVYMTPGTNTFIMATYCVMVPFLFWLIDKVKPTIKQIIAAFICIAGVGLVTMDSSVSFGRGEILTLVGALGMALSIVYTAKYTRAKDPMLLSIVQMIYCAVIYCTAAAITEPVPRDIGRNAIGSLLYLALIGTALAMAFQNIAQKYVNATVAGILLSLESFFGILFSILFYGEEVTFQIALGFAAIFVSVVLAQITQQQ